MEMCFLMVEKAPFEFCYDRYTWPVFGLVRSLLLVSSSKFRLKMVLKS